MKMYIRVNELVHKEPIHLKNVLKVLDEKIDKRLIWEKHMNKIKSRQSQLHPQRSTCTEGNITSPLPHTVLHTGCSGEEKFLSKAPYQSFNKNLFVLQVGSGPFNQHGQVRVYPLM